MSLEPAASAAPRRVAAGGLRGPLGLLALTAAACLWLTGAAGDAGALEPPLRPVGTRILQAFAQDDFSGGVTLYAQTMNPPGANYDGPTTGIGRDPAFAGLRPGAPGEVGACSLNPYAPRPCLSVAEAWQAFRARYRLDDNLQSARIFEAYAEGDFTEGDQLFAEAKGVSLMELLEAAGVESDRLIIEVYPGRRGR